MKKIFNQKNFNNYVGTPFENRANIYINFCLQVHFKVSAVRYCSYCLPPVLLIPRQFATDVVDTGDKFATGVVDTGGAP
jgi:hypothetical protein